VQRASALFELPPAVREVTLVTLVTLVENFLVLPNLRFLIPRFGSRSSVVCTLYSDENFGEKFF